MRLTSLLFLSVFLCSSGIGTLAAQDVPLALWKSRTEFKDSEALVKTYIREIEEDPMFNALNEAKMNYVVRWAMACPYVAIRLQNGYFDKIYNDKSYLHATYNAYGIILGEVIYYLENPFDRDRSNAFRSSIFFAMDMYRKLKASDAAVYCETLELFLQLEKNNTLATFIFLEN